MKQFTLALCALAASAAAHADHGSPTGDRYGHSSQSVINVTLGGLGCAASGGAGSFDARSWSWGASSTTVGGSGGGSVAGKPVLNALSVKKAFDACSPSLLGAVTTGRHYANLTLTDLDDNGVVVATVSLTDVLVTSWNVGSNVHDEAPDESVTFAFRRICVTAGGAAQACYDTATGTTN